MTIFPISQILPFMELICFILFMSLIMLLCFSFTICDRVFSSLALYFPILFCIDLLFLNLIPKASMSSLWSSSLNASCLSFLSLCVLIILLMSGANLSDNFLYFVQPSSIL